MHVIIQRTAEEYYDEGYVLCVIDNEECAYHTLQSLNTYNKSDRYELCTCRLCSPNDVFRFYSICINYDTQNDMVFDTRTEYYCDAQGKSAISKCYKYYDGSPYLYVNIERPVDDDLTDVKKVEGTLLEIARIEWENYQRFDGAKSCNQSPFGTPLIDVTQKSLDLLEEALAKQNYNIAIRKMRRERKQHEAH